MMLDFSHNNGFYEKPLIALWGGRMNDMAPLSYFSPYTLETRARRVPNPAGEPKFYLRLEERFTHVADEVIGPFAYDFAAYMPWEFGVRAVSPENCPCAASPTTCVAGGWYRDDPRETGLAVAMSGANFPAKCWTASAASAWCGTLCRAPGRMRSVSRNRLSVLYIDVEDIQ
jgi:hypothetical protein